MIHIDTSFLIRALVPGSSEALRLRAWIEDDMPLMISAVSWAESLCGPLAPEDASLAAAVVGEAVPLTAEQAERAAELFNASGRRRGSLVDCLIAATTIEAGGAGNGEPERLRAAAGRAPGLTPACP